MKRFYTLLTIILIAVTSLKASERVDQRTLSPFEKISLRVSANMYVEQGEKHHIEITANDQTLDKIIVEVINRKLIIRFGWEDLLFRNFIPGPIEIKVIAPVIDELNLMGSGNIIAENTLETYLLTLNVAGSGDIKLSDVKCNRLEAYISGSGDVIVSGNDAREIKINIAGSGNVKAYQFEAEAGYVRIAGSGNCDVFLTDYLDAKIFGSGNIAYKGDPQVSSNISGSGKIFKK